MFTTAPIPARTVLETCPVLVLPLVDVQQHTRHTLVHSYTFVWPVRERVEVGEGVAREVVRQSQAVPLGLGALFNHSNDFVGGGEGLRNGSARGGGRCNVGWVRNICTTRPAPVLEAEDGKEALQRRGLGEETKQEKEQVTGMDCITYTTLRDIEAGEELCISYGAASKLGFDDVEDESREQPVTDHLGAIVEEWNPPDGDLVNILNIDND